jgi:ABC-type uncharacterized transport system substrate-binding protein
VILKETSKQPRPHALMPSSPRMINSSPATGLRSSASPCDIAFRVASEFKEFADAGGLLSYGPNLPDLARRAATFVDKILNGAKPSDLSVEQPTKFELVINLKTAKALSLVIPPSLLLRADQVIE